MDRFIVSYDLRAPGRNYDALYVSLKSFPAWAQISESTWAIHSESNSEGIREHLKRNIDSNDRLFVARLTGEAAWTSAISSNDKVRSAL